MNLLLDASAIVKYENIILWVLFGLIIFALLFSIFRGSFRGWAYGTYRMIFFIVVIVTLFLTLTPVVKAIGAIDLSKWFTNAISITIKEKTISADVTSVSGTIEALLTDAVMKFNMAVDPKNLSTFVSGLTQSLLKLVVILLYGILLSTLGKFLCWLLWHCAFKFIVPKSKRKLTKEEKATNKTLPRKERKRTIYKKLRGVSMAQEFVINVVLLCMVVIPLTGTINSAVNSFNDKNTTSETGPSAKKLAADDDTYKTIQTVVDTYQNSVFSKAFFGWTVNDQGQSWDSKLLSYLTNANVTETMTVSVVDIVSEAASIGNDLIKSGLFAEGATTFDKIYILLTTEYGVNIISTLANSNFVTTLLPMVVEFAVNIDVIKNYVGNSLGIDYYGYNWSATVAELGNIIKDLQSSDIFTFFTDVDGKAHYDTESVSLLFSDKSREAISNVFDRLAKRPDEKNLFNDLVTVFFVNYALNANSEGDGLSLDDFLPETTGCEFETDQETGRKYVSKLNDAYKNLSLGDELKVVYNGLADIDALDDRLTALIVDSLVDKEKELDTDVLMDIVIDNIDGVTDAIVGKDGQEEGKTCLMDCSFLTYGMDDITDFIGKTVGDALSVEIDMTKVKNELFAETLPFETRKANAKSEMKSILSVVKDFINADPICKEFIKDMDALPGIIYEPNGDFHSIDPGLLDGFIVMAEGIDESKVLSAIVPAAAEKMLSGNAALQELGISKINTDIDGFGTELAKLFRVVKNCMPLIQFILSTNTNLSGASGKEISNVISGLAGYHDEIVILLNGITNNKIINDAENTAYRTLLESLLGNLLGKTITLPTTINPEVENQVVADLIYGLGTYTTPEMLSALVGGGSVSLSALEGVNFAEILKPLDSSEVFGDIIADLLDDAVIPMLGTKASELGLSFKNVDSWIEEGAALDAIVKFGAEIGDITNIDLFGSDPNAISSIIKALSQSQIFDSETGYTFGEYFYSVMTDSLGTSITYFEDKNPTGTSVEERTTYLKNAMESMSKAQWADEAEAIGDIISNLNKALNGSDLSSSISISDIKASAIRGLMYSLSSSDTIGRPVAYHLYEQIGSSLISAGMDVGSGSYGYLNIDWVWEEFDAATNTALLGEMDKLSDFLETAMDPAYGLIDASGNLDASGIDLASTSGKFLLTPLTKSLATSIVFNTIPDGETHETAFECLLTDLLVDSGLYGVIDSSNRDEVLSYVQNVSADTQKLSAALSSNRLADDGPWVAECEALGNLADSVVNLSAGTSSFDPDSFFKDSNGNLLPVSERLAKRQALNDVISAANESKILYRFLPKIVKTGIDSVAASLDAGSATPNYYYMGKGLSADPYGEDEIENLSWVIYYAASADMTADLASLDADAVSNILACLAKSHIFNSSETAGENTFFQGVMGSVFSKAEIADRYYYASNPKDDPTYNPKATYTNAKDKGIKAVAELFPAMSPTSSCDSQINLDVLNGDTYSFKTLLIAIQSDPTAFEDLTNGSMMSLNSSIIRLLGKEIANNKLLSDILVNTLADTFSSGFSSSMIDMSNANPYYCYWMGNDGTVKPNTEEPDFNKCITDDEIDLLADFVPFYNTNSSMFDDMSSITIDDASILTIKEMLTMLNDSYIFHVGKAWNQMGNKAMTSWQSDLTVFEQLYGLIIKESGLSGYNYSSTFDSLKYADSTYKMHDYIKAFTAGELDSSHSGNWLAEINALTNDDNGGGLLKTLLNLGVFSSGVSVGTIDFTSYPPSDLSKFFKALNGIDIAKDIVPYEVLDLLNNTADFDAYSTIVFDVDTSSISSIFDSNSLGDVGLFSSLKVEGTGDIIVSYTPDETNWVEAYNGSVSSAGTIALDNAKAFKITLADGASLTAIKDLTLDTAEVFLSQEQYGKDDGTIDSFIALLEALYHTNGDSYPTIDASDSSTTDKFLVIFEDLLRFIDADNGFYTRAYDDSMRLVSSNETFLSRDIVMRNFLKIPYDVSGTNYILDLGARIDGEYAGIYAIFESSSYSASIEGDWFSKYMTDACTIEHILDGNIGTTVVGTETLPMYHTILESLASKKNSSSTDYLLIDLASNASSSLFGTEIIGDMNKEVLRNNQTYALGGTYFKGLVTNDAEDDALRVNGSNEGVLANAGYIDSFDAINNEADRLIVERMLRAAKAYGFKAYVASSSDVDAFKTVLNEMASSNSVAEKMFYQSAIYDYMANHDIYHGDKVTGTSKVSIPNAFDSSFSFASVSALLA